MTLPSSGPLSLNQICDEYSLPRTTAFPSGFYGKPGFPSSGPWSINQCYGLSNWNYSRSSNPSVIVNKPDGGGDGAFMQTTLDASFSYAVVAGVEPSAAFRNSNSTANRFNYNLTLSSGSGTINLSWTIRVTAVRAGLPDLVTDFACVIRRLT